MFELTPEQQIEMDRLEKAAKSSRFRLSSPSWKKKNERRLELIDKKFGNGLSQEETKELDELKRVIYAEHDIVFGPTAYYGKIMSDRLNKLSEKLKKRYDEKKTNESH